MYIIEHLQVDVRKKPLSNIYGDFIQVKLRNLNQKFLHKN